MTRRRCLAPLVAVGALALYLYTALPEPGWIDSGFLATCSALLDIPHPTAKQLYILISRVFLVALPGHFWPLVCLSALAVSAAVWVVTVIPFAPERDARCRTAVTIALVLATAPLVWEQATVNEVHGLQLLLFALFLYVFSNGRMRGRLPMLFYLAGLALSNHGTAIYLAPFLVAALWPRRRAVKSWLAALGAGLFGLTLYLYFPLRSSAGVLIDWGGTSHWSGFVRHITGWQYAVWLKTGNVRLLLENFATFGRELWDNFPWALLPLGLYGLWVLARRSPKLALTTIAGVFTCAFVSASYNIPDIPPYYLLAVLVVALWISVALGDLSARGRTTGWIAVACALISAGVAFPARLGRLDLHDFHVATDWVRDASETIAPGGVVLSREWDHCSPWLYLRFVTGFRPDVTWIDTELLRRSWYPDFIRRIDPQRYARAKPALDRLAPEIQRFEAGLPYVPAAIESAYADAIYALTLGQQGPVYVDGIAGQPNAWGVERVYLRGATEVPWGLLTRVERADEAPEPLPAWPNYRNASVDTTGDRRTDFHLRLYDRARAARRAYER